jgi:putative methionine-R-sulfoxide reductase with GAF domain
VLAIISGKEWRLEKSRKDKYIFLAAIAGTGRELLMFLAEYGSYRGHFSFDSFYRFYPPLEHAATMLVGIFISYAFMRYGSTEKSYQTRFLAVSSFITVVIYFVTAFGWPSFLSTHPKISFAMYGGDLAFRIAASLILGIALASFLMNRMQGTRVAIPLILGISFLLLDELLMILNIATMERNSGVLAPIRHNLHIWAIPFFISTYWTDLAFSRKKNEAELVEQHQRLEDLNSTLEARINKIVTDLNLRDWFKSGQNELNTILRGDKSSVELADKVLAFLISYLNAGVGVFYLYDEQDESLEIISLYAVSGGKELNGRFALGEGLPGQVALEKKPIFLNSVPPDYLPIGSALGEADPLNIVLLPVLKNEELVGVLELGSFKMFTDNAMEFLNMSMEAVAISFSVNNSRKKVDELLEQMQAQAEELRVQQEELQQSNEELLERSRMLEQLK